MNFGYHLKLSINRQVILKVDSILIIEETVLIGKTIYYVTVMFLPQSSHHM